MGVRVGGREGGKRVGRKRGWGGKDEKRLGGKDEKRLGREGWRERDHVLTS